MCHSVEFYMPSLARQAAEHRLGPADLAAARRERAAVDGVLALWRRLRRPLAVLGAAVLAAALAGCAAEPPPEADPAQGPADTQVVGAQGAGSGLETFSVRRSGQLFRVEVFNLGDGGRRVVVTKRSGRGIDRGDARLAYDAAYEAGTQIDCAGQPLLVDPDSAVFQDDDQRTALTQGPAFVFQGRCG